jgi:hypothetical protein
MVQTAGEGHMQTKKLEEGQPEVGYFLAGRPQPNKPMALTEIHGDERCVFGDGHVSDLVNDPSLYSKRQIFGFSLGE